MPSSPAADLAWLIGEFSSSLAAVFETMAGERPVLGPPVAGGAPSDGLLWRQPFAGIAGILWIFASEASRNLAAGQVLRAAGMEDADRETLESTYLETVGQGIAGLAQAISGRLGREVTSGGGEKTSAPPPDFEWIAVEVKFAAGVATLSVGVDSVLLAALGDVSRGGAGNPEETADGEFSPGAAGGSKTFELLLDVEMPVSVSFGRAQVPLKDVLKLTTGSIVELNRSIVEPVEVIVNNCVIARGEVVVVEGNFGVRIQHVVSRQERLRTLN